MDYILQVAKDYGLFVALVVYVLWDTRQRELRYLGVIGTLSGDVQRQLTEIKSQGDFLKDWLLKLEAKLGTAEVMK